MSKSKHEDNVYDHEGNVDVEATIEDRGERKARYVAPGTEQKWRARDLVDIHWAIARIECPASYNRILSCIIGHANPNSGACYPRHSTIAIETGYSVETVKRAIRWWVKQGFLVTESRGTGRALAYHPQWKLLESFWIGVACEIDEKKAEVTKGTYEAAASEIKTIKTQVTKGTYAVGHQGDLRGGQYADLHNLKVETLKKESHPERVHPPSVADTTINSYNEEKERCLQKKEEVERPSTNSQPLEGPSSSETQRESEFHAHTRLEAGLRRLPNSQYSAVIEWLPYPGDVYSAAIAAEIDAPNTGAVIVLDAYRKENAR